MYKYLFANMQDIDLNGKQLLIFPNTIVMFKHVS